MISYTIPVSYTHLRAHETVLDLVCRLLLEKKFGWRGVSFELDDSKVEFFNLRRKNKCICTDATSFDYKALFDERNYPKQIDYLQLDIDPCEATFETLKKLPLDDYRFSVITYEHELYRASANGCGIDDICLLYTSDAADE